MERLEPQILGEIEAIAMAKLAEQERLYVERAGGGSERKREGAKAPAPAKRST
jgi:hypothetical protein